jgi:hypothetical protein
MVAVANPASAVSLPHASPYPESWSLPRPLNLHAIDFHRGPVEDDGDDVLTGVLEPPGESK